MNIDVLSENDPPTAEHMTVRAREDVPYPFSTKDFGYKDIDDDPLSTVVILSLPDEESGVLMLEQNTVEEGERIAREALEDGHFTYLAPLNAHGQDFADFLFKVNDGFSDTLDTYLMSIDVAKKGENATGAPRIRGRAEVGQPLRLDLSSVHDADGLSNAEAAVEGFAFDYQWFRLEGESRQAIAAASYPTYKLREMDEGSRLVVRLRFADDQGQPEEVFSPPSHHQAALLPRVSLRRWPAPGWDALDAVSPYRWWTAFSRGGAAVHHRVGLYMLQGRTSANHRIWTWPHWL